jgi:hypothetical protein
MLDDKLQKVFAGHGSLQLLLPFVRPKFFGFNPKSLRVLETHAKKIE